jgi:hypothetical protein
MNTPNTMLTPNTMNRTMNTMNTRKIEDALQRESAAVERMKVLFLKEQATREKKSIAPGRQGRRESCGALLLQARSKASNNPCRWEVGQVSVFPPRGLLRAKPLTCAPIMSQGVGRLA